jgi:hypothetical protein
MAAVNQYSINLSFDSALVPEKQWTATVMYKPTAASTPTVPSVTTGPLGSSGTAAATYTHGDGTATGFADPLEAIQKALILIENDRSVGN